ncbi:MAG: apolipoprotein N-acyltransferase [Rhodospirillales bacterium]
MPIAAAAALRETADFHGPWRWLRRIAAGAAGTRGWRRGLLAVVLGTLAVLALPPLYIVPTLIPAFTGLLWMIEGARNWRVALATGFCFGMGFLTGGLYWVANALLTRPEEFGMIAPLAPVVLAAILAPWPAVACALTRLVPRTGIGRVLMLAGAWTLMEWVRSWAWTGFPWNLIGSVWAFSDAMLQGTSLIGTYGLGLVTVAAAAMPSVLTQPRSRLARPWLPVLAAWVALLLLFAFGVGRLAVIGDVGVVDGVWLRLVQGNIPQNLKWRRDLVDEHLLSQIRLAATPADPQPTHVLWSEAAAPLFLSQDPERLRLIGLGTPPDGLTLLGTLRTTPRGAPQFQVWNSMLAVDGHGEVVDSYDKAHLVPFGEFMPLRHVLGLGSIAGGMTDFSRGDGVRTLRLPGLPPVGPLICYEIVFPGAVVDPDDRPDWLFNLTNDGWYGFSTGPYQHLVAARLRAVEEGLPVVRVANTGISAIIDPLGRVRNELGLEKQGIVDGALPLPLATPPLFARTGPWAALLLAAATMGLGRRVGRRWQ